MYFCCLFVCIYFHAYILYVSISLFVLAVYDSELMLCLWVDPLSNVSFQPVLCNKGHDMCYLVCGMVPKKYPLLLIGKSNPCGGSGFPLPLSEWYFTICPKP